MSTRAIQAFRAKATGNDRVSLDIYDVVGSDPFFGGGVSSKQVLDTVRTVAKDGEIFCRINSAGGIVTEGMAIYNLLTQKRAEGVRVVCRVDALAGSIASIIAMAGELEMAEHSFLMIHNPFGFGEGQASDFRNQASVLDAMRSQMLDIYAKRAGGNAEIISKMMDAETWIEPGQAIALGLADRVVADPGIKLAAQFDLSAYRNIPKPIRAQVAQSALDELRAQGTTTIGTTSMHPLVITGVSASTTDDIAKILSETFENLALTTNESPAAATSAPPAQETTMAMTPEEIQKMTDLETQVATLTSAIESEKTAHATTSDALAKTKKAEADDEEEDEEKMAKKAVVEACMAITGVKDIARLEGAVMALGPKLAGAANAQAARSVQVEGLIAKGKLMPAQRKWAMKCSAAALDQYLESLGDAKVGPVGEEHTEGTEDERVVLARASASIPAFDPAKVTLNADEEKLVAQMGINNPKLGEQLLADKRSRAEADHRAKYGSRTAA